MNDLLELIDVIDQETCFAEMEVCNSLLNTYSKSCMILEQYEGDNYDAFEIFQEGERWDRVKEAGSKALEEAKGDKSENIIIRIIKFIPRLIAAFIRNLRSSKKGVEKKVDQVQKLGKQMKDLAEHPEKYVTNNAKSSSTEASASQEPAPEPAMPRNGELVGSPYGTDDKTIRANARKTREERRAARQAKNSKPKGPVLALPYIDNGWKFQWYMQGDVRVKLNTSVLTFAEELNKDNIDFITVLLPVEYALNEILKAMYSGEFSGDENSIRSAQNTRLEAREAIDAELRKRKRSGMNEGIISSIKRYLSEAKDNLSKISSDRNAWIRSISGKGEVDPRFASKVQEAMLGEIIKKYLDVLDWMKYTEKSLQLAQKKMEQITSRISHMKSDNSNYMFMDKELDKTSLKDLSVYVNETQKIVQSMNDIYQNIIKITYAHLDTLHATLLKTAEESGIIVDEKFKTKTRSTLMTSASAMYGDDIGLNGYKKSTKKIIGLT